MSFFYLQSHIETNGLTVVDSCDEEESGHAFTTENAILVTDSHTSARHSSSSGALSQVSTSSDEWPFADKACYVSPTFSKTAAEEKADYYKVEPGVDEHKKEPTSLSHSSIPSQTNSQTCISKPPFYAQALSCSADTPQSSSDVSIGPSSTQCVQPSNCQSNFVPTQEDSSDTKTDIIDLGLIDRLGEPRIPSYAESCRSALISNIYRSTSAEDLAPSTQQNDVTKETVDSEVPSLASHVKMPLNKYLATHKPSSYTSTTSPPLETPLTVPESSKVHVSDSKMSNILDLNSKAVSKKSDLEAPVTVASKPTPEALPLCPDSTKIGILKSTAAPSPTFDGEDSISKCRRSVSFSDKMDMRLYEIDDAEKVYHL